MTDATEDGTTIPKRGLFTRSEAYDLLRRLDELLPELPGRAEVYAIGGAAMALEYDRSERRTEDIDCIIKRYREEVIDAAERVAEERQIPADWLNDQAQQHGTLPTGEDRQQRTSYEGTRLVVRTAGPERMLAMKLAACRDRDRHDIERLIDETGVDGVKAARAIYAAAYQGKPLPASANRVVAETTGDQGESEL